MMEGSWALGGDPSRALRAKPAYMHGHMHMTRDDDEVHVRPMARDCTHVCRMRLQSLTLLLMCDIQHAQHTQ